MSKWVAALLVHGVQCTEGSEKFIMGMANISANFPGAFGTYRRNDTIGMWVPVGAVSASAMTTFLGAYGAGTGESLCYL